jgi:flagellar biosynthesis protein
MNESGWNKSAALTYTGQGAPRLIAKGEGELAQRIRAVAEELDIPIVEEAGLVEMLCQIPLGEEIPPTLYVAVAEVLAHVFRLNHRINEVG